VIGFGDDEEGLRKAVEEDLARLGKEGKLYGFEKVRQFRITRENFEQAGVLSKCSCNMPARSVC